MGTPEMPFIRRHWLSTGRSDSKASGGADRKLSGLVGQNWSMMTPWGMYMKPMRTGGLAALPFPDSAHPMDSNHGRASEAPMPLRHVRRSMRCLFPMGRRGDLFLDAIVDEGIAGDDLGDKCL